MMSRLTFALQIHIPHDPAEMLGIDDQLGLAVRIRNFDGQLNAHDPVSTN